jgi:hypothetical protein
VREEERVKAIPRAVGMRSTTRWCLCLVAVALATSACARVGSFQNLMGVGACDPRTETFTTEIDNPYFPLPAGHRVELQGDGFLVRITVSDEVKTVAGVETRVVEEYEALNGRVVEISRNFFAQNAEGTVCYFGEEVDIYDENGEITSHSGSWAADGDRFRPGIFMPGSLEVGQAFRQEVAPGVAEDQAKVIALGEVTEVPAGTFEDTATLRDRNPLDGTEDTKIYARGIGLIVDEAARLTNYSTLSK